MNLASLRTNQVSDDALRWYGDYLDALKQRDLTALLALVADDCTLQVNNGLPTFGKAAIAAYLDSYWSAYQTAEHEPVSILGSDDDFAVELLCHYTRLGGDVFTIPCCSLKTRRADGLLTSVRIFADVSPLAK